ncbi:MAG: transglycosylase domain-containing protein [bacterium]|nr:transglycosylase domain-containing protein [bacterium]
MRFQFLTRLKRLKRRQKILLAVLTIVLLGTGFIYGWLFAGLPSIDQLEAGLALPSTRIYDRDGVLLYEILPPEQGRNVALTLDEIPDACEQALIATEDANFYSHPGVDIVGVVRALWINVRGGEILAGGSTITQQVARNLLLDPQQRAERTLQRKLKEMILAVRLQNAYSKDEVLALYLNQSYFGNLAYGIEAGARAYFGKSAGELSLAECALLAGLVQNPAFYDPLSQLEQAEARQEIVLGLMVNQGYLTQAEAAAAKADALQLAAAPFPIQAPHFVMAVWQQLERDYGDALYTRGLEVVTTVDLDWQNTAQEIVQRQLEAINHPTPGSRAPANANNAAVVAIDPYTGQVLTMLGSPDYFDEAIDGAVNAALAPRQPGSALKPFTYAAAFNPALETPWTAGSMVLDVETPFVTRRLESYTPANYGLVEHGPVLIREALASSYNIPPVVVLEDIGIGSMVQLANNAGLTTLAENTEVDLSITLGGGEVRLLEMAQAYSVFPNGGHRIQPSFLLSVKTRDGDTLYEWRAPEPTQRVLDERIAWLITDILSDPEARTPGFGRNNTLMIGRPAAAKTGTTTDFRDNWVMGYTPNLVVGVWVGNADNTPMADITGVSGAGPIWNAFMRAVLLGQPELSFTRPDDLIRVEICALSGLLPTDACQLRRLEWFIPGTEPTTYDSLYQVFEIDRATGLLADESTPAEQRVAEVFVVLPQEARDWGARNGVRQPPPGAVAALPDDGTLRLLEPDPYTVFEISQITPTDTQRLRLTVGAPTGTQRVRYLLNGREIGTATGAPWVLWWPLQLGTHQLVAEAQLADGTTQATDPLLFTVVEDAPPQSRTVEGRP